MRKEDTIIKTFFDECCKLYGSKSWAASAWASQENQHAMFRCLSLVGDMSEGSILDVGCGQGDFYDFVGTKDYTGIDISKEMIERAKIDKPDVDFQLTNLLDYEKKHDWIVVGGPFNLRVRDSDKKQMAYLQTLIEKAYSLAESGLVFTVLSENMTIPERQWAQLFYYKPAEILNMCLSLSNHAAMDHITLPSQAVFYMPKMS
jgi:SAM-dependent methyltransferase